MFPILTPAPLWKRVAARLFGRRIVGEDIVGRRVTRCIAYHWRGAVYVYRIVTVNLDP